MQLKGSLWPSYISYRCNGESLVQDAIVHQPLVDVTRCLADALQETQTSAESGRKLNNDNLGELYLNECSPCGRSRLPTLLLQAGSHIQQTGL